MLALRERPCFRSVAAGRVHNVTVSLPWLARAVAGLGVTVMVGVLGVHVMWPVRVNGRLRRVAPPVL
jgi:hypothetical protein